MSFTTTTQLEAVNVLLDAIGQAPVSTLSGTVSMDVTRAMSRLDLVTKEVQTRGCTFNMEDNYTLTLSGGSVALAANMVHVDFPETSEYAGVVVIRGSYLYNKKEHTYAFPAAPVATVTFLLDWTSLPEYARNYITIRAARMFQDSSTQSESGHRFTQQDENAAYVAFQRLEGEMGDSNFLTNYVSSGIGRRLRYQ